MTTSLVRTSAHQALEDADPGSGERDPRDPRAALLGLAAWAGAWAGVSLTAHQVLLAVVLAGVVSWRTRASAWTQALLVLLLAGCAAGSLRAESTAASQVAAWADQGAVAAVELVVTGDPRTVEGRFGPVVLTRAVVVHAEARGLVVAGRAPVLVRSDPDDPPLVLGRRLTSWARFAASDGRDLAAMLSLAGRARVVAEPDGWWRGAAAVRSGVREAVEPTPPGPRGLVPALVDGDDGRLPDQVEADFRTTGLTHLLAVSGTNLTLVSGFLVALARLVGVRGRGLQAVAAAGIVGFVLLARGEPSVLRAAAMGTVGLVALGTAGRHQGPRAWGVAVGALVLVDPWLARSPGFALSALATAGILWWSPTWRDALLGWMPRWLAEAVAVSAAAQLACTPVIAALSGEVSLTAVAANLLAGPVVGVATVAGLLGGLAHLVVPALGTTLGWLAGLAAGWIIAVATWTARLPTPAIPWPSSTSGVAVLAGLCLLLAAVAPRLLRRRGAATALVVLLTLWVVLPPSLLGALPGLRSLPAAGVEPDWLVVQCDVGQGDAVLLRAGPDAAVVVDAGPEEQPVADCLADLGVTRVPRLVLSHFHADHVAGVAGVLGSAAVGEVLVSGLAAPASGVEEVVAEATAHGVPVRVPAYGETGRDGSVAWQVVGPGDLGAGEAAGPGPALTGELDGSVVNDASLVLLADVGARPGGTGRVRVLLTGDVEPGAQTQLGRALEGLEVDVLKVPHHGSAHQDLRWLTSLGAGIALVGVGENDYGHPAPETLAGLARAGVEVGRTDTQGRLAVVHREGRWQLVRQR